jgi:hypothetical protein
MTIERRQIRFESLDDVVRDAEGLLAKGYDRAGNWDLAQVCGHVANWMTYPVEGFPRPPAPIRAMLWLMKKAVGRGKFEKYLAEGMPAGKPTMPESVPPPGGDPAAAVARLKQAVEKFKAAGGVHPSPLFGPMTKDEATRLQLIHAAHHLSFLVPKS